VWDHVPNANEILEARVEEGWQPTASSLKEGDRVVGHASCLAERVKAGADKS